MTDIDVEPVILCENLVRIYSTEGIEVQALQGLNLRVDPGEVVAIIGASGSGKSTLLNILSGIDKPTGGRAQVAGRDLTYMSDQARVLYQREVVGFVWQQTARNLLPYLTAVQNVEVPMILAGHPGPKERRERAEELLDALGIPDKFDSMPAELSGGQQQRVAIAVALANRPAVLLADEPTGALDRTTSAEVLDLMRTTSEALGVTMLVVTHDPTVSDHVRRTIQIRDGRTSTEVLRRVERDEHGNEHQIAEELTVIDRSGRLQLPEHYLDDLGLKDRVRLTLEADHAGVWPERQHAVESGFLGTKADETESWEAGAAQDAAEPGSPAEEQGSTAEPAGEAGEADGGRRRGRRAAPQDEASLAAERAAVEAIRRGEDLPDEEEQA